MFKVWWDYHLSAESEGEKSIKMSRQLVQLQARLQLNIFDSQLSKNS